MSEARSKTLHTPDGLEAMLKVVDLPQYRDWGGIPQGWLKMNAERLWWHHLLGW